MESGTYWDCKVLWLVVNDMIGEYASGRGKIKRSASLVFVLGCMPRSFKLLEQTLIISRKWLWIFVFQNHFLHTKVTNTIAGCKEDYYFKSN